MPVSMSTSTDRSVVAAYPRNRPTIPEMLLARQQFGTNSKARVELSSRIAWNPTRMQNLILCVGPGTPASVCVLKPSQDSADSQSSADSSASESEEAKEEQDDFGNAANSDDDEIGIHNDDDEDDDDDDDSASRSGWMRRRYDDNDNSESRLAERTLMEWMDSNGDSEDGEEDLVNDQANLRFLPSIRHGGCINTAGWLTSPWKLSFCGRGDEVSTLPSEECPTQLMTSGDDRQVKFWDVRHAIGTSNPLAGGKNTFLPFSSEVPTELPIDAWKDYQSKSPLPPSGSVIPLATLHTRHLGNVFHVTALDHEPGKIVTCGADGYLRCGDLSSGTSSIIVSPEFDRMDSTRSGLMMNLRPGMCFSHHFVDAHAGLLCSERGLRRFDIRLSAREQNMRSMLSRDTCKACALWTKESMDSVYIFAGGASADVGLYDLRMVSDGGPPSRIVQLYRPRDLCETSLVSVSGIDISKNKKELLVSYENDQIYTFPICPTSASSSGPTVDELTELSNQMEHEASIQPELCAYGGHLNRYTFLKNAKYAGPNDEYICTGSDSGHAWIYDKFNGSVVSFLNADHSTCNGVIPHPTLPIFVTYGIDSTAKLWRATVPVDIDADDSPLGRWNFYRRHNMYHRSPLVSSWSSCRGKLAELKGSEEYALSSVFVMPDEVPSSTEDSDRGLFGGLSSIFFRNRGCAPCHSSPFIGNDLPNLPQILRQNLFACLLAHAGDDDSPVRSSINNLRSRMSNMRLFLQAQQRGLIYNQSIPWQMKSRKLPDPRRSLGLSNKIEENQLCLRYGDPADLVPESPCDWIPYDPEMSKKPLPSSPLFNLEDYRDYYEKHYLVAGARQDYDDVQDAISTPPATPQRNKRKLDMEDDEGEKPSTSGESDGTQSFDSSGSSKPEKEAAVYTPSLLSSDDDEDTQRVTRAWQVLTETVWLLKESGNKALKAKLPSLAARRYDQAIQYCAVVFLRFPSNEQDIFLSKRAVDPRFEWSQLLTLLITSRLNLSMVMLNLPNPDPKKAADMALMALRELGPFVVEKGKVRRGKKLNEIHTDEEPESTYLEAKPLQAKAFFRLGSAQLQIGDNSHAVNSFEASIKSIQDVNGEPEGIVKRRLAEAKHAHARKSRKHRKKLRTMFGGSDDEDVGALEEHRFDFLQADGAEKQSEHEGSRESSSSI